MGKPHSGNNKGKGRLAFAIPQISEASRVLARGICDAEIGMQVGSSDGGQQFCQKAFRDMTAADCKNIITTFLSVPDPEARLALITGLVHSQVAMIQDAQKICSALLQVADGLDGMLASAKTLEGVEINRIGTSRGIPVDP